VTQFEAIVVQDFFHENFIQIWVKF